MSQLVLQHDGEPDLWRALRKAIPHVALPVANAFMTLDKGRQVVVDRGLEHRGRG